MIKQSTINEIFETAQIEEVIGEFLTLKKRGVNYVALCPFHSEKTPSFTVSPSKGIYKCFGCGEAGNAVNFLMEHENYTYPEALTYLAEKYNIEIEDTEQTPEEKLQQEHKESLYIVNNFARQYFTQQLFESDEGKKIGLTYFKERGYREATIKKFNLGYAPDGYEDFTNAALDQQYKLEFLKEVGLTSTKGDKKFDFFRGRVIFPIHNLSGKVIAFAGRTLKKGEKLPKYLNTKESEIYHKSKAVYGLFHAKKAIRKEDECFVVEGYTDVLSLHQAEIENVVASSGTSLTKEQIRIIGRYTNNLTIIFDGDEAGTTASLRGIDLILEQGLNVKILTLPEGQDPDSYLNELGSTDFKKYIDNNKQDFVLFKTKLLLEGVQNDPTKKAEAIQGVVRSIAKIPDHIKRSLITKECSRVLDIEERVLVSELNKIKRKEHKNRQRRRRREEKQMEELEQDVPAQQPRATSDEEEQERDLIRIIIEFGHKPLKQEDEESEKKKEKEEQSEEDDELTALDYIIEELEDIELKNALYNKFYQEVIENYKEGRLLKESYFLQHEDEDIRKLAIDLTATPYSLSKNWLRMHDIFVSDKESRYVQDVYKVVAHLKLRKVQKEIDQLKKSIKSVDSEEEIESSLKDFQKLTALQKKICDFLGTVVVK